MPIGTTHCHHRTKPTNSASIDPVPCPLASLFPRQISLSHPNAIHGQKKKCHRCPSHTRQPGPSSRPRQATPNRAPENTSLNLRADGVGASWIKESRNRGLAHHSSCNGSVVVRISTTRFASRHCSSRTLSTTASSSSCKISCRSSSFLMEGMMDATYSAICFAS